MSTTLLDTIEINTAEHCKYSVIWLHGLGASGHDFEPIVPELKLPEQPGVRFIFPHAPVRPITVNGGATMPGWYDITSLDFGSRQQDTDGVRESAAHIDALIKAEIQRGVPAARIVLAGFSQGGAIALYTALTSEHALCGVIALSTYLPIQETALAEITEHAPKTPVFMAHGQFDEVIELRHAKQSFDVLDKAGMDIEWHDYPIPHSVNADEITDVSNWLKRHLGQ